MEVCFLYLNSVLHEEGLLGNEEYTPDQVREGLEKMFNMPAADMAGFFEAASAASPGWVYEALREAGMYEARMYEALREADSASAAGMYEALREAAGGALAARSVMRPTVARGAFPAYNLQHHDSFWLL